jgi:sulfatase maturation enzyme AslB (radical SAM superfamily)
MLESISLSLSSVCGANCIFCPDNLGKTIKPKLMPFEYAKKIVDEIASKEFVQIHNVKTIEVGGNGDAFLNRDLIHILRYIKQNIPNIEVKIFTNFQNFSKERAETILEERLIDSFCCNIDAANQESYFTIKHLDLKQINKNLTDFVETRKKLNSEVSLTVFVLTLNSYISAVYNTLGFYPTKLKNLELINIKDDFTAIKKQLKKILDLNKDKIIRSGVVGWAERHKVNISEIEYSQYTCKELRKIKKEAFIASDGSWYLCCLDASHELILGNVIKQSINEIFFSEKRKQMIEALENREFARVGGPCLTVNCCQYLGAGKMKESVGKSNLPAKYYDFLTRMFRGLLRPL